MRECSLYESYIGHTRVGFLSHHSPCVQFNHLHFLASPQLFMSSLGSATLTCLLAFLAAPHAALEARRARLNAAPNNARAIVALALAQPSCASRVGLIFSPPSRRASCTRLSSRLPLSTSCRARSSSRHLNAAPNNARAIVALALAQPSCASRVGHPRSSTRLPRSTSCRARSSSRHLNAAPNNARAIVALALTQTSCASRVGRPHLASVAPRLMRSLGCHPLFFSPLCAAPRTRALGGLVVALSDPRAGGQGPGRRVEPPRPRLRSRPPRTCGRILPALDRLCYRQVLYTIHKDAIR